MRRSQSPNLRDATFAVGVAGASALMIGLVLTGISSPANFKARMEVLQAQSRQAQDLMRPLPAGSLYPVDAICRHDPGAAAKTLRDSVTSIATQAGLSLDVVDARPELDSSGPSALTPVRLRFTVTGPYEGVVTLLGALSRERPNLFADGVDLTSKTSNVTASFSGRAFCSA